MTNCKCCERTRLSRVVLFENTRFQVWPVSYFLKQDSKMLLRWMHYCFVVAVVINFLLLFFASVSSVSAASNTYYGASTPEPCTSYWDILQPGGGCNIVPWEIEAAIQALGLLYLKLITVLLTVCGVVYTPQVDFDAENSFHNMASRFSKTGLVARFVYFTVFGVCGLIAAELISRFRDDLYHITWVVVTVLACCTYSLHWFFPKRSRSAYTDNVVNFIAKFCLACVTLPPVRRRFLLALACVAGVLFSPVYYSLLLLDMLYMSVYLKNVLQAVTQPAEALLMTTVFGVIIMYIYAMVGFFKFRDDFDGNCDSVLDCTVTTIYHGLRSGGGIGDFIKDIHSKDSDVRWYSRIVYDLSFFVVITVVLLNVIFGIILDTFGALRAETQQRKAAAENIVFISSLQRAEISHPAATYGIADGFTYVEKERQNKWSLRNFLFVDLFGSEFWRGFKTSMPKDCAGNWANSRCAHLEAA